MKTKPKPRERKKAQRIRFVEAAEAQGCIVTEDELRALVKKVAKKKDKKDG